MAKKSWASYALARRDLPGVWELVTRPTPDTAMNPARLEYLKQGAELAGLKAEIRPLYPDRPTNRAQGLWVCYPEEKNA